MPDDPSLGADSRLLQRTLVGALMPWQGLPAPVGRLPVPHVCCDRWLLHRAAATRTRAAA